MVRILVVEDDATVREAVAAHLVRAGHDVRTAPDGGSAVQLYAEHPVDLVLLDLMLPVLGGLEVTRRLRSMRPDLPIIMLTARAQEHERVQGLQRGADDYVTKPFSMRELELRIRSVLRRARPPEPPRGDTARLRDGDLEIDLVAREVRRAGAVVQLTGREFDLLVHLVRGAGQVFSRDELIREVWGWDIGDGATVTVHVRRLREKIEDRPASPTRLVTVFGRGYRWDAAPVGEGADSGEGADGA